MVNISVTGTLPSFEGNPIPDAMEKCAELMEKSIVLNFLMSGRPTAWTHLKSGKETPLVVTGKMMNSVSSRFDDHSAEAGMLGSFPQWYWIHQEGGTIKHPGSTKAPIPMVINGVLIFRWMKEPYTITIPPRPFVMFQDIDVQLILDTVKDAVLTNVKQERIN